MAPLLVVILGAACLGLANGQALPIVNVESVATVSFVPACSSPDPQPVTDLAATPQDGGVALSWLAPANAACASYVYNITYAAVGPTGEVGRQTTTQAWSPSAIVSGLANGVVYRFAVKAVSKAQNDSAAAPAVVNAVPNAYCDPSAPPAAPTAVRASGGADSVRLCWGAPSGGGCASEYRLAMRMVPLTDEEVRATRWSFRTLKSAGCMTLGGLADRRSYQFALQAYSSSAAKAGPNVAAEATVTREWRCMPVPNWYKLCASAADGGCNPQSCAALAKAGMCGAPWMREVDASTKTVVQYCADFCQCTMDASAADPGVEKFDGEYDGTSGCCRA